MELRSVFRRAGRVAAAVFLAGLAMSPTAQAATLEGTAWVLSQLPGRSLVARSNVTLQFEAGKVAGSDGCNRYSGAYVVNGEALLVEPLAGTQMACVPELMEQAAAYTRALNEARSFRRSGKQLQLLGADGELRATLDAQSTELAGTSWRVMAYNNGKGAVASLVQGTTVTVVFGAEGRVSGSAGCNRYTAGYGADGANLKFTPAAATRKLCPQPAGVMEQEQAFLQALTTVATARVDGNRLTLRTAAGAIAANLERAPAG